VYEPAIRLPGRRAAFSHRLVVAGISGFLDATASCRSRESEIRPPIRSSIRFFDLFPFRSGREIPGRESRRRCGASSDVFDLDDAFRRRLVDTGAIVTRVVRAWCLRKNGKPYGARCDLSRCDLVE